MSDKVKTYIEEQVHKYGSLVEAKKEMMKEYIAKLNEIIQHGALYGDERIESLKIQWQKYFDVLDECIEEDERENALSNMELLDENEDCVSYTLNEITQDILDRNGVGSFSSFS